MCSGTVRNTSWMCEATLHWHLSGPGDLCVTTCMLKIYLPMCSSKFNSCSHLHALRMERRDANQRGRPEEEAEPRTMTPVIAAVREEICCAAITVPLLFTCSAGMFAMRFLIISGCTSLLMLLIFKGDCYLVGWWGLSEWFVKVFEALS